MQDNILMVELQNFYKVLLSPRRKSKLMTLLPPEG